MVIAIVEDVKEDQEVLKSYLEKYAGDLGLDFDIRIFPSPIPFLDGYKSEYDIIFMDVKMPYMNGFTAAKRLREIDGEVILFFTTSLAQYAIRGYEVEAMDYIVKPFNYYDFSLKLTKAVEKVRKKGDDSILVSAGSSYKKIPLTDIIYVEVSNHICIFHTAKGDFKQYSTLKKLMEKLPEKSFARINGYSVVNMKYVTEVKGYTAVIQGAQNLDISHPRKKEFMENFMNYTKSVNQND